MKKFNRDIPLISIHIPKTGGTSFRDVLFLWFREKLLLHYFDEKENSMPIKYKFDSNICIHGHFNTKRGFGVNDYYPQASQFITFLRDPFEILLSRFFYVKRNENSCNSFRNGEQLFLPENINEYLEKEIDNKEYHPNILNYFPIKLTKQNYKEVIDENYVFIGLMEDYQNSINRLALILNFQQVEITKENISERFQQIDNKLYEKFIKNHTLEYEVYNYIREIYYSK